MTIGACKEFETETQQIKNLKIVKEGNVIFAPENFYNKNIIFNALPASWLKIIENKLENPKP